MKERIEWVQSWCDEATSDDVSIIDYHCHLDDKAIKEDKTFSDIGELWLSGDHYKWSAVRLCCVSEGYITGYKSINGKFCKLTEIIPAFAATPFTHGRIWS